MFKRLAIALILTISSGIAFAGMWNGFPIVGGGSYCSSTVNGVCVNTVPGVSSSYGGYLPMDTWLGSGQNPQTALMPTSVLGGGAQNVSPAAGDTVALSGNISKLFIKASGTLATLTVTLPASTALFDGQQFYLASDQAVTTLTLTAGSGTTIATSTTSLTANTPVRYVYMAADLKWIKS